MFPVETNNIMEERFIQKRKLLKFEVIIFYIWVLSTKFMFHELFQIVNKY